MRSALRRSFYGTGIRRAELARLNWRDLDIDRRTLMVRQGKGRKDRMVPIGPRALAWIDRYLVEVRPRFAVEPDDGTLFLTVDGTGFSLDRLTQLVQARGWVEERCYVGGLRPQGGRQVRL